MGSLTFQCFDQEYVARSIAAATGAAVRQVRSAIGLLEEGNTLPFIARYRKEVTDGLDETALRKIEDALAKAHELARRKATILRTIDQQELLTPELRKQIEPCQDKQVLEDLYLPFKPKRRTRAATARERGLQPLADLLLRQRPLGRPRSEILRSYLDPKNHVPDEQAGMILEGMITNVTRFGAFVDLGVHQDGLIHISELANQYVRDPGDVVAAGDLVRVKVLDIDLQRRRIAVSRKQA